MIALTVAELIEELQQLPQDYGVYFVDNSGGSGPRDDGPFAEPVHDVGVGRVRFGSNADGTWIRPGAKGEKAVLLECPP